MVFWRKLKQNCLYPQNNLVTKVCYTVQLGGSESSVIICWKIKETILKHFVRGWLGGRSSERNSEMVNESEWVKEGRKEGRKEWMNEGRKEGRKEGMKEWRNKGIRILHVFGTKANLAPS